MRTMTAVGRLREVLTVVIVVCAVGFATPANAGPAGDPACRTLWPGFEDDTPRGICLQLDEFTVGASTTRLFVHEDVPERRVSDDEAITLTEDAVTRSVNEFTRYGPMPSQLDLLIVRRLPPGEDANAGIDNDGKCVITFSSSTFTEGRYYQQVVAHELFHCFQFEQESASADDGDTRNGEWWFEGTAEYFANVVFPDFDFEYDYLQDLRDLEPGSSLVDLSYEAWPFFQHMANRQGNAAVVELMKTLPAGGGRRAQMRAAAAWPGMDELFFDFAKAYLSNGIIDANGSPVPINAPHTTLGRHVINRPGEIFRLDDLGAFEVNRIVMTFPEHREHDMERDLAPEVRTAAQNGGPLSPWEELPDPIQTCNAEEKWRFVMTTTAVDEVDAAALKVVDIVDDEGDTAGTQCCVSDAEGGRETRAERRDVRIVVCGGGIEAVFRGGVCWVEDGFLMVTAGYDTYDAQIEATGPYPRGYAFILGTATPGSEPSGFPDVTIADDTGTFTDLGVGASLTKSTDLLTGTFTSRDVLGSYRCPRLTPVEELDAR